MRRTTGTTIAMLAIAMLVGADHALAQRDATSKIRREYYFYGRSADRSMQAARDTSQAYRQYAQRTAPAEPIEPQVAHETADVIGDYIAKAQRHMAWMRRQAGNDMESLASLDVIDKHLANAAKSHREMHDICLQANIDAAGSMKCCQHIDDSLATAIAEHDKLMKRWETVQPQAR